MATAATGVADAATANEAAAAVATAQAATAGSSTPTRADSTPARGTAVKDRECPYCHEFFTSSSLGRHLDQFIKDDKPKQPDGKHNVDEIQRLRGSVTRRQARSGSGKRNSNVGGSSGFQSFTPTHSAQQHVMDRRRNGSTPQGAAQRDGAPLAKRARHNGLEALTSNYFEVNRPNWMSTGIISNLDGDDPLEQTTLPFARPRWAPEHKNFNFEEEQRRFAAERDEGRAAKLALTEVIDSIKASVAPSDASSPFPFDFLAQPFPSLVLHLLPAQRTIFSAQLIPSADAWPIELPDESHLKLVRARVTKQLDDFARAQTAAHRRRRGRRHERHAQSSTSAAGSRSPSRSESGQAAEEDEEREANTSRSQSAEPGADSSAAFDPVAYTAHLEGAWAAWAALPAAERASLWHLTALRAFVQEQQDHEATRRRLERAEQQLAHQAAQVRRLSSLQQPREYLLNPTTATPLDPEAARKVAGRLIGGESGEGSRTDPRSLNADALIAKWTPAVRGNRRFQRPLMSILEAAAAVVGGADAQQRNGDVTPINGGHERAQNGGGEARMDLGQDAAAVPGGRELSPSQAAGEGNSADASGDDEDGGGVGMAQSLGSNGLDTVMLDPTLGQDEREPKDDGEFGAEGLLAKLDSGTLRKRRR